MKESNVWIIRLTVSEVKREVQCLLKIGVLARDTRTEDWFEVIVGKSLPEEGKAKCLAFVSKCDTKTKRRLFEWLKSQGMQPNQQVTFFSDGGETVRNLPRYLNPESEHWLDWFHITMRLTVMGQMTKGIASEINRLQEIGKMRMTT